MKQLSVAVLQLTSVDSETENTIQILNLLKSIEGKNVKVAFLPENCLYLRVKEGTSIPAMSLQSPSIVELKKWVDRNHCALHLGSVPISENQKLYNSSIWLEPNLPARISYSKVHLFDITLTGQKPIRESDVFAAGTGPSVLNYLEWKFGQSICYDLRFAELYSEYANTEVSAILIPSCFLVPTGKAHWETLIRARAIESQCYVIASAQSGVHQSVQGPHVRETYGHSLIVSPWGEKLVEMSGASGIEIFELNQDVVDRVRQQIPMKNHRRLMKNKEANQ